MVNCPICGELASETTVNLHLDKGCPSRKPGIKKTWSFLAKNDQKQSSRTALSQEQDQNKASRPDDGSIMSPRGRQKIGTNDSSELTLCEESNPKYSITDEPVHSEGNSADERARNKSSNNASPNNNLSTNRSFRERSSSPPAHIPSTELASSPASTAPPAKRSKAATYQSPAPLAEQMRPQCIEDYIGQSHLVGPNGILASMLARDPPVLPSMVLWGPSGVGKTSLARILAAKMNAKFVELSAPSAGSNDVKRIISEGRKEWQLLRRRTVIFLDEIHRFNRSQQDSLLAGVERGDVTLIGATTENPSFKLSGALLSRLRVFVLQQLSKAELRAIVVQVDPNLSDDVINLVVDAASATGDARQALNMLETVRHLPPNVDTSQVLKHSIVYDQRGDFHYDLISAFHKSIRGSDADAALYYLARMLSGGEDPLYISRRLMRIASEDIGSGDDSCLPFAVAVHSSVQQVGMPECDVMLAHAAVKFANARKSVDVYKALKTLMSELKQDPQLSGAPVPLHLRNAPTKLMEKQGYGKDYKYNPNYKGEVDQTYLPDGIKGGWLGFEPHLEDI